MSTSFTAGINMDGTTNASMNTGRNTNTGTNTDMDAITDCIVGFNTNTDTSCSTVIISTEANTNCATDNNANAHS